MLGKDLLKYITREAGKDVATIVQLEDKAANSRAQLAQASDSYEEKIGAMQTRLREAMTQGVESAAMAGAVGFGIGGGIAYLAHDQIATYFGKGSWPALLALPGTGIVIVVATPSVLKDKPKQPGENAPLRAGGYGLGLGLLAVGGYFSYQDYGAPAPKKP